MLQLGDHPWLLILLSSLEILLVIVPVTISSQITKKSIKQELHQIGLKFELSDSTDKIIKFVIGVDIGIGLLMLSNLILFFFQDILLAFFFTADFIREGFENAIGTQIINPNLNQFIIFVIIQFLIIGPCEESFFRGFIITKLRNKINLGYIVLFSSLIFALYHVPPFLVPISTIISFFGYYFTIGIILALIFIFSDFSLIPVSIAHSVFNFLVLIL